MISSGATGNIEWAVAGRPFPGQAVSGDMHLVAPFEEGVLLALIDGLGHGEEAARASRLAADTLAQADLPGSGVADLFRECHEALRSTRGAVATLIVYQPRLGTLEWGAIGNVEAVLWRRPLQPDGARLCVTPRGGVVGYQLPKPLVGIVQVEAGDICCLASDGISSAFVEKTPAFVEPCSLADHILARFGKMTDDALVLAVRFGRESL